MTQPHGGKLVDRVFKERKESALQKAERLFQLNIDEERAKDIQNIAHGVFSPLQGFLNKKDFLSVLEAGRLENGLAWTIPVVLDISPSTRINEGKEIALNFNGKPVAILNVEEIYDYDKSKFAEKVFGTTDAAHPGVAKVMKMNERLVAGNIDLIEEMSLPFSEYYLKPTDTRALFKEKGWKTVVGFQTRNVPHLGHEYCQKTALTFVDGLFINPVIGKKKAGDFRDEVILESHEALIRYYYPEDRVVMSILPFEMRYAGPREAILHAIVRKNFGCTHFVVGRDHAGVGNYYPPYAAQEIFSQFTDLEISPIFFREFFYCRKCLGVMNEKTCPHKGKYRVDFSGTGIRERLVKGEKVARELMRTEVVKAISRWEQPFVD
jgi:sulfate adenylyltransferase